MTYTRNWNENVYRPVFYRIDAQTIINQNYLVAMPQTRSGTKVDNWKEKVRAGSQAGSAYSTSRSKVVMVPGEFTDQVIRTIDPGRGSVRTETYAGVEPGILAGDPTHLALSTSKAESIALSKTYDKVRAELQRLNSPAVLAEILSVFRQFGRPFEAIVGLSHRHLNRLYLERRGLKGSTQFKSLKWKDIVASTYLEYSFGLAPMMSDAKGIAEAFARWQTEEELPQLRAKCVGRGLDSTATTAVTAGYRPSTQLSSTATLHRRKMTEVKAQYTCGLSGSLQAAYGSNDRLIQLLGFDSGNWVPAIWEAIPWSWLVDYFTNVQEILEASVTATSRVSWIVKTVTTKTEETTTSVLDGTTNNVYGYGARKLRSHNNHGYGSIKATRTTMVRTLPGSLGVPPIILEHPFGDLKKLANLSAVLLGRRPASHQLWLF